MSVKPHKLKFHGCWRETETNIIFSTSGVYGIYAYRKIDKRMRLMYIGESNNVQNRIEQHKEQASWRNKLQKGEEFRFNAAFIPPPERNRKHIEAAMIYQHKPPHNVEYTDNFPFDTITIETSGENICMKNRFTVYRTE